MENDMIFDKEVLSKILNEKYMIFTLKEIEELMDSEVEKDLEEMDTELLDMCAEILVERYAAYYHEQTKD